MKARRLIVLITWKQSTALLLSVFGIMLLAGIGEVRSLPEPATPNPLNPAEVEQFRQLIQRYQSIYAHASVTGDVSSYPSVFYNDPAFDLREYTPGCFPLIDDERSATNAILNQFEDRPRGSKNGMLSCMIAEQISYHRNVNAWEVEIALAAAEDRNPSIANLDEGRVPMERSQQADAYQTDSWGGPEYVLDAVYLDVIHVRFVYAAVLLEEIPEVVYHYIFTNVDGNWLMSAGWTSFPGFND